MTRDDVPSTAGVLDMAVVEELLALDEGGDPELLLDLVSMFLEDAPQRVQSILEAASRHDHDVVERAAHSLKGSAGNLGASGLQTTADGLQQAAREGDSPKIAALLDPLQIHLDQAVAALRRLAAAYE